MNTKKHKLWSADEQLFASMEGNYLSVNEENSFRKTYFPTVIGTRPTGMEKTG